jgi:hypothetical protein
MNDLLANRPAYDELVEVLAHHIRDHWLRDDGDGVPSFDHMYCSGWQIAAAVLEKLGIMKRAGDGKYSTPLVFACEPRDFASKASGNRERGCSYDTVVLALLAIMEYGKPEDELYRCLARLRICIPDDDGHYAWTEKQAFYVKELYPRWTSLIA